jgi:uncharacterized protein YnzC (UPF0291/DUF896 family)
MPEIEALADIDPDDFWNECNTREKKDMIDVVVEACSESEALKSKFIESLDEHFPDLVKSVTDSCRMEYTSIGLEEFHSSLEKLGQAYFRLSNEDIDRINELAKRF